MNARATAAAIVGALDPDVVVAIVQAALTAFSQADGDDSVAPTIPRHPDGFTCAELARRYSCSPSLMRSRIADGEFGPVGEDGGPEKRGRAWIVPACLVAARDKRALGGTELTSAIPTPSGEPTRAKRPAVITSLTEHRRIRGQQRGGAAAGRSDKS